MVIICVLGKYLAAVVPALAAVLYVLQKYYLRSSRQLRLLNIEAKAPLYKIFIETVSGISTIRSFHWQTPFHKKHRAILDDAQKPFYMLMCIQQWLALVLDLIVGAIAVILVTLATSLAGSISPGALGVGLVLILEFSELITQALQAWTKMETSIGAVARVQQFVEETPSDPTGTVVTPATWPARGAISFNKLSASYSYEPSRSFTLTGPENPAAQPVLTQQLDPTTPTSSSATSPCASPPARNSPSAAPQAAVRRRS